MMNLGIDGVCAVIITHFPDSGFVQRLKRIAQQAKQVLVIDNGSDGQAFKRLELTLRDGENVELIRNKVNLGVATALNQGVRKALEYGYSWIVTFDQDSVPDANMVEKMLGAWEAYPNREKLFLLGPTIEFPNCTQDVLAIQPANPWEKVTHVITSGSLFSKQAFVSVGYFLDCLFIDYVDIEYCLRLRRRGYDIVQVRDATLLHRIGDIEQRNLLGRIVRPTHHDPIRRYYQFRNAVLLCKIYRRSQAEWCKSNAIKLMKIMCLVFLYEKRKIDNCHHILKGLWHGFSARAGRRGEMSFSCTEITRDVTSRE